MATLGTITVGIIPYMLPLFIQLRDGIFCNLQYVRHVEFHSKPCSFANVWCNSEQKNPIRVDEPYLTPFRQLIEKFNKEIMKEL